LRLFGEKRGELFRILRRRGAAATGGGLFFCSRGTSSFDLKPEEMGRFEVLQKKCALLALGAKHGGGDFSHAAAPPPQLIGP